ncbi:MAG: hypothetical protein AB7F79_04135 [Steroidobacteraceae bacterium]
MTRYTCKMGNDMMRCTAYLVLATLTTGTATAADIQPDWSGYWIRAADPDNPDIATVVTPGSQSTLAAKDTPSLTPEYAEKWNVIRTSIDSGSQEYIPTAQCLPPGVPRNMFIPYSGQIEMRRDQVTIITEWAGDTRRIYLDGRSHPDAADLDPTYQGHSIGSWDGNTLVVDTVGIVDDTRLNGRGMPHSDQLHMTEWFHEYKPGFLEIRYRLEDPIALTKPYEYKVTWQRSPIKHHEISEFICTNNKEGHQ